MNVKTLKNYKQIRDALERSRQNGTPVFYAGMVLKGFDLASITLSGFITVTLPSKASVRVMLEEIFVPGLSFYFEEDFTGDNDDPETIYQSNVGFALVTG